MILKAYSSNFGGLTQLFFKYSANSQNNHPIRFFAPKNPGFASKISQIHRFPAVLSLLCFLCSPVMWLESCDWSHVPGVMWECHTWNEISPERSSNGYRAPAYTISSEKCQAQEPKDGHYLTCPIQQPDIWLGPWSCMPVCFKFQHRPFRQHRPFDILANAKIPYSREDKLRQILAINQEKPSTGIHHNSLEFDKLWEILVKDHISNNSSVFLWIQFQPKN